MVSGRVSNHAGIPFITPTATNEYVTRVGPNIFRTSFIDPFQGEVMAKFVNEELHLQNIGIFTDSSSSYSTGLANAFRQSAMR